MLYRFAVMKSNEAFESLEVKFFVDKECSELDLKTEMLWSFDLKTEFQEERISRKKSMAGELGSDERADHPNITI